MAVKMFFDTFEPAGFYGLIVRRYVIDAEDVPFIKEQLAGEIIEEDAEWL
jgi:hypothetical protein